MEELEGNLRRIKPDKLMSAESKMQINEYEHMALFGTTNTGKTFKFKTLLIDDKFNFDFEEFIFVGRPEQLKEISAAYASLNLRKFGKQDAREMKYFPFTEVATAIAYVESNKRSQLLFMDDIFIQGNKIKDMVAQFINQAKNAKCTCVLTIHEPFEGEKEKRVRNACNWYGMFNLTGSTIARLTDYVVTQDSEIMQKYMSRPKLEKILFFNKLDHLLYDYNYLPLLSIKNTVLD